MVEEAITKNQTGPKQQPSNNKPAQLIKWQELPNKPVI